MPKSFLSEKTTKSTKRKTGRAPSRARSVSVIRDRMQLNLPVKRANSRASKTSAAERLNPLIPAKKQVSPQKRAENLLNIGSKKLIKLIIGNNGKQLEYQSQILDLIKHIKAPDTFWAKWFEFKYEYNSDVRINVKEFIKNRNQDDLKNFCEQQFTCFNQEINELYNSHRESFKAIYKDQYASINKYIAQVQKISMNVLCRKQDLKILCRDLEHVSIQLEAVKITLPKEYERFFIEYQVGLSVQPSFKSVVNHVMAPFDEMLNYIKYFINPKLILSNAETEVEKLQTSLRQHVTNFPREERITKASMRKKKEEEAIRLEKRKKRAKINHLKAEISDLEAQNQGLDEKIIKIHQQSNKILDEMRAVVQNRRNEMTVKSPNKAPSPRLEAELTEEKDALEAELNALIDPEAIKALDEDNMKLYKILVETVKKVNITERAITNKRALVYARIANTQDEATERLYLKNADHFDKIASLTSDVNELQMVYTVLKNAQVYRQMYESYHIRSVPDPEKKLKQQLATNDEILNKYKNKLNELSVVEADLRNARREAADVNAIEELNAEQGQEYEAKAGKIDKKIANLREEDDDRSDIAIAAENIALRKDYCTLLAIKEANNGNKEQNGAQGAEKVRLDAEIMIQNLKASEPAYNLVSNSSAEEIEEEYKGASKRLNKIYEKRENAIKTISKMEAALNIIYSDDDDIHERVAAIVKAIDMKSKK